MVSIDLSISALIAEEVGNFVENSASSLTRSNKESLVKSIALDVERKIDRWQNACDEKISTTGAIELVAQCWFNRPGLRLKLLVWESSAPGADYYLSKTDLNFALTDDCGAEYQRDLAEAPSSIVDIYRHSISRYVVYDNGADYRLVAYEA